MKKTKKTALTAALFAATITVTGCGLYGPPASEDMQTVYGPPPTQGMTAAPETTDAPTEATTEKPTEKPTEKSTAAPTEAETVAPVTEEFRPEDEEPQDLYGPPVDEEEPDTYLPQNDMPAPIYGPPQ